MKYILPKLKLFIFFKLINFTIKGPINNNNIYYGYNMLVNKRIYHTSTIFRYENNSFIPSVVYPNVSFDKALILKNNKGKTGVYRWSNLVNSKTYVGSAKDLRTKFWVYFSICRLINSDMPIYKSILKYGYKNFKLEILEYCDHNIVLLREQYYIDLLKPEYNILSIAGSTSGYRHTAATLTKFNHRKLSDDARANLSISATGRILSKETRAKISSARSGRKLSIETKAKLSAIATVRQGVGVEVKNIITGDIRQYNSYTLASIAIGINRTTVRKAALLGKIIKSTYVIKLICNNKKLK